MSLPPPTSAGRRPSASAARTSAIAPALDRVRMAFGRASGASWEAIGSCPVRRSGAASRSSHSFAAAAMAGPNRNDFDRVRRVPPYRSIAFSAPRQP